MAEVIIHETLQPTDEVLARHRRALEESGTRVLGEPQVELVPNPHAKVSNEPSEFYRITFQVEAPEEVPGVEALSDDELAAVARFVRALVDHDEAALQGAGAYDRGDPYEFTRRWRLQEIVGILMRLELRGFVRNVGGRYETTLKARPLQADRASKRSARGTPERGTSRTGTPERSSRLAAIDER
jgi:hypothetical protein